MGIPLFLSVVPGLVHIDSKCTSVRRARLNCRGPNAQQRKNSTTLDANELSTGPGTPAVVALHGNSTGSSEARILVALLRNKCASPQVLRAVSPHALLLRRGIPRTRGPMIRYSR